MGSQRLRRWLPLLILIATVWFLAAATRQAGWEELRRSLARADAPLLLAAFAVNLLRYAIWTTRWWLLARPVATLAWGASFEALMASVFVNTVIPAARPVGGLVRARHLARSSGQPTGPLFGAALVDQFGYSLVSIVLGATIIPLALRRHEAPGTQDVLETVAMLAGLCLLGLLLWRHRRRVRGLLSRRLPAAAATVEGALEAAWKVAATPRSAPLILVGASLVWGANILTYRLAAAAVSADVSLVAAAVAFSLGSLAGSASGTPGGAGTTETAAILPLLTLGIPTEQAFATVLLARSCHYITALALGGACAWRGWRRLRANVA